MILSHTHAQGVQQLVCMSVVVAVIVIGTKIARSHVLDICACCKYNQSLNIGEKLVYMYVFQIVKKGLLAV